MSDLRSRIIEALADGRNPECVKQWPECVDGEYNPQCCRFPKSCSCGSQVDAVLAVLAPELDLVDAAIAVEPLLPPGHEPAGNGLYPDGTCHYNGCRLDHENSAAKRFRDALSRLGSVPEREEA